MSGLLTCRIGCCRSPQYTIEDPKMRYLVSSHPSVKPSLLHEPPVVKDQEMRCPLVDPPLLQKALVPYEGPRDETSGLLTSINGTSIAPGAPGTRRWTQGCDIWSNIHQWFLHSRSSQNPLEDPKMRCLVSSHLSVDPPLLHEPLGSGGPRDGMSGLLTSICGSSIAPGAPDAL